MKISNNGDGTMTKEQMTFEAAKIADFAGRNDAFRAELIRRLQGMDAPTYYSGQRGDQISSLSSFLSQSVSHYIVSCGQVMTHSQAVYCERIRVTNPDKTR